jgi:hypothetical protein
MADVAVLVVCFGSTQMQLPTQPNGANTTIKIPQSLLNAPSMKLAMKGAESTHQNPSFF